MQSRFLLRVPGRHDADTPLNRLCVALGTHPWAVVLSTLGFRLEPWAYERPQDRHGDDLTWFIDAEAPRAQNLAQRWELPASSPKALATTDPAHPFLAGMCALETLAALEQWGAEGGEPPALVPCGKFLRPSGRRAGWLGWAGGIPAVKAFAGFGYAAAIAACGFHPWPEMGAHGPLPVIGFAAESVSFPGLLITDLDRVLRETLAGGVVPARALPGFPAEEHPFFYTLQSILALQGFRQAQELARRQPRIVLRSKNSPASVIASSAALREGNKATEGFREAVRAHLKKSAPRPAA